MTGAGGFIGRALCAHWRATGRPFRAVVRRLPAGARRQRSCGPAPTSRARATRELDALVAGAAAIVHLAGRAHVMVEAAADPAAAYRSANVEATLRLARAAVRAGVARFVFASSIKVNGEATMPGRPFGPADAPAPADDYARSKLAAEEGLAAVAAGTALAPIVLRLPLVYGPGVGANFLALVDAVARRRVLPLGAVRAKRSLLYVGNLAAPSTRCSMRRSQPSASTASPTRRRWPFRTSSGRSPARWASRRGCPPCRCRCSRSRGGSPDAATRSGGSSRARGRRQRIPRGDRLGARGDAGRGSRRHRALVAPPPRAVTGGAYARPHAAGPIRDAAIIAGIHS